RCAVLPHGVGLPGGTNSSLPCCVASRKHRRKNMRINLLAASAALVMTAGAAFAQDAVIVQETAPVVTGSTVVVPGEVRTYVMEQSVPSIAYEGEVVVGAPLPETVEVHTVDGYSDYAYTVVNERRELINPQTRTVIQVLE